MMFERLKTRVEALTKSKEIEDKLIAILDRGPEMIDVIIYGIDVMLNEVKEQKESGASGEGVTKEDRLVNEVSDTLEVLRRHKDIGNKKMNTAIAEAATELRRILPGDIVVKGTIQSKEKTDYSGKPKKWEADEQMEEAINILGRLTGEYRMAKTPEVKEVISKLRYKVIGYIKAIV